MRAGRLPTVPDLIVLSHLRWDFVWQRPQHLISRIAAQGRRTWFIEEPRLVPDATAVAVREVDAGPVTRLWIDVPGEPGHCGFDDAVARELQDALPDRIGKPSNRVAWLYTPLALPLAQATQPDVLVYDVMDDLASFAHAPAALRDLQRKALVHADLVFTGGRSLQAGIAGLRPDALCFPSGVEPEHYATARRWRRTAATRGAGRPTAGYVGVIDERLDLDLVAGLADALPDWEVRMVGPVVKISEASLPRRPNLIYPGPCQYADLPRVMGQFDVALMPFALNEATRSISPTKTLEYLAAGLPVVSTRVPDVVACFDNVVDLQDGPAGFAEACRRVLGDNLRARDRKLQALLHANHWDTIAGQMAELMERAARPVAVEATPA